MTKGWVVTDNYNVVPIDDEREHVESEQCWCKPWYDEEILVHNSADQREKTERKPV